jgi:hypothetical protein
MNDPQIELYLPTFHQKIAVTVLAGIMFLVIIRMVRLYLMKEEHALLWFLGAGGALAAIWIEPLLVLAASSLGITVPASAFTLMALFFLVVTCIWLTSCISRQNERINSLIIDLSIINSKLSDLEQRKPQNNSVE